MIRPYFTVIKDAFDEALASRVLWILLGASTLVLLGLAPLGVDMQRATELRFEHITDWPRLMERLRTEGPRAASSPSRRIIELADAAQRTAMGISKDALDESAAADATPSPEQETRTAAELTREMIDATRNHLNNLLQRRDFYQAESWGPIELDADLQGMLAADQATMSAEDIHYLNWRLLKAAFPNETTRAPAEEMRLVYFHWPVSPPIPLSRALFTTALQQIVAGVMNVLVGTVAIFIAILVTAPLIPQTFEAGSIDLLLSKPVTRWLLFLAKFLGACTFIFLNAGYFIVGLWFILGWRFGTWNHRLLFCIPIFMFLFMIYYAVSALAGVLWRNATVSIVISILFWAVCFAVGLGNDLIERIYIEPQRIVNLGWYRDTLLAVGSSGQVNEWRNDRWQLAVPPPAARRGPPIPQRQPLLGPVELPASDHLLTVPLPRPRGRFAFLENGPRLTVSQIEAGTWQQTEGPTTPAGVSWLLKNPQGEVLLVSRSGVQRIDSIQAPAPGQKILGWTLPVGSAFTTLWSPPDGPLAEPLSAAIDGTTGALAIWSGGTLYQLQLTTEGRFTEAQRRELDVSKQPALVAYGNNRILVADSQGAVRILTAGNLQEETRLALSQRIEPYMVRATDDGKWFGVLFHNGKLVVIHAMSGDSSTWDRDASAFAFQNHDRLLIADRADRVSTFELASGQVLERRQGPQDLMQKLYYWGIHPFYTLFPKPGELSEVVNYFLTSRQTVSINGPEVADLRFQRETLNVRGPLINGAAFVCVVLGITCWYIQRLDL